MTARSKARAQRAVASMASTQCLAASQVESESGTWDVVLAGILPCTATAGAEQKGRPVRVPWVDLVRTPGGSRQTSFSIARPSKQAPSSFQHAAGKCASSRMHSFVFP